MIFSAIFVISSSVDMVMALLLTVFNGYGKYI